MVNKNNRFTKRHIFRKTEVCSLLLSIFPVGAESPMLSGMRFIISFRQYIPHCRCYTFIHQYIKTETFAQKHQTATLQKKNYISGFSLDIAKIFIPVTLQNTYDSCSCCYFFVDLTVYILVTNGFTQKTIPRQLQILLRIEFKLRPTVTSVDSYQYYSILQFRTIHRYL